MVFSAEPRFARPAFSFSLANEMNKVAPFFRFLAIVAALCLKRFLVAFEQAPQQKGRENHRQVLQHPVTAASEVSLVCPKGIGFFAKLL